MIRKVRFALCVAVLFLLQTGLVHRFTYGPLRPDLLLLAGAFLALEADFRDAIWGAFAIGLLRDFGSAGRLGTGPVLMLSATAALLFLRGRLLRENVWTDLLLAFAYVLGCGVGHAALVLVQVGWAGAGEMLLGALGQAAVTTALAPLVFAALCGVHALAPRPGGAAAP